MAAVPGNFQQYRVRRSALSIATNIAEGCGKNSRADTLRYLEIASGSAAETEHVPRTP
ncbi:MAG: hypothetical protein DMD35_01665 [Gemmatimonadetes bacterium]|nr:MAG: hypothetical protein DMD35_01665 [Gemmatimonadota bacterium]